MGKFSIKESENNPNHWECSDNLNIVVTFEHRKYDMSKLTNILIEMEKWLIDNYPERTFDEYSGFMNEFSGD